MCDQYGALRQAFSQHVADHGLSFATKEEYEFRFDLFAAKDKSLNEINADPNNTFTVEHNKFSTWTKGELKRILGYNGKGQQSSAKVASLPKAITGSVDWRKKGAVNPVKN